jgi:signal recognition particle subunit SRP54
LTGDDDPGALKIDNPPSPVLMVGLQGGGKTTTTAKIAKRLKEREGKRVLMASLDVNRPAAMEQLAILGQQIGVDTLPIVKGEDPVAIAKRAKTQASLGGYDVYMLDTAGRLSIDEELMAQVEAVRDVANPRETLLVVDGLTGQDAVHTAENFDERIGITGVILTRMDGDGRGGAALSMRAITGKPIRFVGLGEKMDALETFEPSRIAGRILGMGDIVGAGREGAGNAGGRTGRAHDEALPEGSVQHERPQGPARADDEDGRHAGHDGHDARHGQDAEAAGRGGLRRHGHQAADRADQLHDQEGTRQPRAASGQPQEAHRGGCGAGGERSQQASEDAAPDGRRDEEARQDGQEGPAARRSGALMGKGAPQALKDMDPGSMDPKAMEAAARQLGQGGLPGLGGGALPPGLSGFGKKK